MAFLGIGFLAMIGVTVFAIADWRNTALRAQNAEVRDALKSGVRRLNEMHIEQFNSDRERATMESRLEEADETIRRLQSNWKSDQHFIGLQSSKIHDLEAKLAPFKRERGEDGRWSGVCGPIQSTSNPPYTGGAA